MTRFVYGATTLQFNCDPVRSGGNDDTTRLQPMGRYSDGRVVVYDKSDKQSGTHVLPFVRLSSAVMTGLLDFLETVQGVRYSFVWTDHLGRNRTVRFKASNIDYAEVGPDRFAATVTVIEDEPL